MGKGLSVEKGSNIERIFHFMYSCITLKTSHEDFLNPIHK